MAEVKAIFSKEAEKQLELIDKQINNIYENLLVLSNQKLDFKSFKEYSKAVEQQKKQTTELTAEEKKLQQATERLAFSQSDAAKELTRLNEQTKRQNTENRDSAKSVLVAEKSWEGLTLQLKKAEKEYRDLAVSQGIGSQATKEAQKRVLELRDSVDAANIPIKRFSDNVGNYKSAFDAVFPQFAQFQGALEAIGVSNREIADNSTGVVSAFANVKAGIVGATRAAIGFIMTPIGASIALLVGISAAAKAFFKFNTEIAKTNKLVESLANTSGKATDTLREQATAISKVYGRDFNDSVKELSELQRDFGLSAEDAFIAYNRGLALGGDASNEFGDSIREYGELFAQAGYSADEFLNILNAGIDLGVYNDKLPDAIKEAGLSLKEQTKSTKDALVNAFGASFTDEILQGVSSGSKTIKQALEEISRQSQITQLNQQQLGQLTADVFKGAGEDAGGALKVFEAINLSIGLQTKALTPLQEAYKKSAELANDFEAAQTRAFKSDAAVAFIQKTKNAFTELKTNLLNEIADYRDGFTGLVFSIENGFNQLQITIASIPKVLKASFIDAGNYIKTFVSNLGSYRDAAAEYLKGNNQAAKNILEYAKEEYYFINETSKVLKEIQSQRDRAENDLKERNFKEQEALLAQSELEKQLQSGGSDSGSGNEKISNEQRISNELKRIAKDNADALIAEQERIQQAYIDRTITAEQAIIELGTAQQKYNDATITDSIALIEEILDKETLSVDERKSLTESLYDFEYNLRQKNLDDVQLFIDKELKARKDANDEIKKLSEDSLDQLTQDAIKSGIVKVEENKKANELLQEQEIDFDDFIQGLKQASFALLDISANEFFTRGRERREAELIEIQETEQKKIDYINYLEQTQAITSEEAEARRIRAKEDAARKEAAIKRKQAQNDKAQAIFNIVLSTAQAVISALAQSPPNIPQAIASGVIGAVQLGIAASRPIPQFYKGTDSSPEGLAYVGERGAELLEYPSGEKKLAMQETLTYLPKGTKVHTADQTKELMKDDGLRNEIKGLRKDLRNKRMSVNLQVNNNSRIDYLGL